MKTILLLYFRRCRKENPAPAADEGVLLNRYLLEFDVPSVLIRTLHIRGNVKLTDI